MEGDSAITILEALLREAHRVRASDIHLDPSFSGLLARLRIDGSLYDSGLFHSSLIPEILARLKVLAGLRIDEHMAPQDGRFRFKLSTTESVDVRISITPTYYGENAVLRLFSSGSTLPSLAELGFTQSQENSIHSVVERPHGLILVTGPTGSGKTSTLYSLLSLRNVRATSIITIEDPIEFALPGIVQIPVNPRTGLTFASGLRSILRQDPNVLGVGEIRDEETASLAIHAALTGHLVLSTLHTIDAPTTIPRLLDMKIEPYLIASTLSFIISQRLLKRLCPVCDASAGCNACNGTGVSGRIGVFEILPITAVLRAAVIERYPTHHLLEIARAEGMQTLHESALKLAHAGIVCMKEAEKLRTH
jgi:type II secretory ATPase GspE/PulE/Tfp pilus assembly ATPase PilB-like protein